MGESPQDRSGSPERRRPGRPSTPPAPGSAVLTPPTGLPAVGSHAPAVPDQRTPPEPVTPPQADRAPVAPLAPPPVAVRTCACGHPEDMHEHYRAGDDCGACGPRVCASFRDRDDDGGPLRRAARRLRG